MADRKLPEGGEASATTNGGDAPHLGDDPKMTGVDVQQRPVKRLELAVEGGSQSTKAGARVPRGAKVRIP